MKRKRKYSAVDEMNFVEEGGRIGLKGVTREHREQRINKFIEFTWPEDGKARLPRSLLLDTGMRDFMENLNQDHINFSNTYIDMLDWFISFMDSLPDTDDVDDVASQARKFHEQQANAGHAISFTDAVAHVTGCSNEQVMNRTLMAS